MSASVSTSEAFRDPKSERPFLFSSARLTSKLQRQEERAKAKIYLCTASGAPHTREILLRAFDEAWEQIAPKISERPRDIKASRMVIAEVLLRLSKNGCRSPNAISREAVAYWG